MKMEYFTLFIKDIYIYIYIASISGGKSNCFMTRINKLHLGIILGYDYYPSKTSPFSH